MALLIVAAAVLGAYVLAYGLGPWRSERTAQGSAVALQAADLEAEVVAFLESYFATWSAGDMEAYRAHFHEQATIVYVEGGAVRSALARDPFVDMQAALVAQAPEPMTETIQSYVIDADGVGAVATVEWLLQAGARRDRGVDRFVLVRQADGAWKAVSLLFYVTERGSAP